PRSRSNRIRLKATADQCGHFPRLPFGSAPDLPCAFHRAILANDYKAKLAKLMKEFSTQSPIRRPTLATAKSVESIRKHLVAHAPRYFPALSGDISIRIEEVKRPSTNALVRFVLSDGYTAARVIAKWAPVYAQNNEGLTEFWHYRLFNSSCGHQSAFGCPTPLCFVED